MEDGILRILGIQIWKSLRPLFWVFHHSFLFCGPLRSCCVERRVEKLGCFSVGLQSWLAEDHHGSMKPSDICQLSCPSVHQATVTDKKPLGREAEGHKCFGRTLSPEMATLASRLWVSSQVHEELTGQGSSHACYRLWLLSLQDL